MSFGDEKGWKSWRDIRKWREENEYKNIVKRMDYHLQKIMSYGNIEI